MARQPFNIRWGQSVETQNNPAAFQTPPNTRLGTGWEGGQDKDAPPAGHENWWHNRVDSALQDLERFSAMAWHAQAIYGFGGSCRVSGLFYESIASNNINNPPATSPNHWRLIGTSLFAGGFSVGEYKDVAHNGSPAAGWLKCTGAVLLRAAYPRLFDVIGTTYNIGDELSTQFRLPDWRGMFPRCLDDGRAIDTGRAMSNTPQASQNLAHGHSATASLSGSHSHNMTFNLDRSPATPGNAVLGDEPFYGTGTLSTGPAGAHTHTISIGSNGGTEARPVNLTQVRWIRYL